MLNEGESVIKNNPLSFQNLLASSAFTIIEQLLLVGPIVVQVISIISCCSFYCLSSFSIAHLKKMLR